MGKENKHSNNNNIIMPTITNRSPLSRGFKRDRKTLSKKLRCQYLGSMTQQEFLEMLRHICQHTTRHIRTVEYGPTNKATIHFFGPPDQQNMAQYSYRPIYMPTHTTGTSIPTTYALNQPQLS